MKKILAIILEIIPIASAIAAIILFISPLNIKLLMGILMLLSVFGFEFFIIARKLHDSKLIKILGIIDVLVTLAAIIFYIIAKFAFGL